MNVMARNHEISQLLVSRTLMAETCNPKVSAVVLFPPSPEPDHSWQGVVQYGVIRKKGRLRREVSHYGGIWLERISIPENQMENMPMELRYDILQGKVIYQKEQKGPDNNEVKKLPFYRDSDFWQPPSESDLKPRTLPAEYTQPVKFLGIKKCLRLLEDSKKKLARGESTTAGYLQYLTLYYMAQLDYVLQDRTIPPTLFLGYNGVREDRSVRGLVGRFDRSQNLEERQEALYEYVERKYREYTPDTSFWESPPLRFSLKFKFDNLLFEESHHWIWKLRDKVAPIKSNLGKLFETLNGGWAFQNLDEVLDALTRSAKQFPQIKGILLIGSAKDGKVPIKDIGSRDVDLVIFISGFYFKRIFAKTAGIYFDVLGVPMWLGNYGLKIKDPMTVECLSKGKILMDPLNTLHRLQEKAKTMWESPGTIGKEYFLKELSHLEILLARTRHLAESQHPNWRFGIAEVMDKFLRLTFQHHQVWLPGAQERSTLYEKIDPQGSEYLKKIIIARTGSEVATLLEQWETHFRESILISLPPALVVQ